VPSSHHPLIPYILPPFLLFYDNKLIFTIIDCFSKKLWAYEISNTNGIEIINKLKEYPSNFPAPKEIQADNGTEFANKGIENFLKYNNIKIHFTTPNHHNSNGLINRTNSTLIEIMNIIRDSAFGHQRESI
jgi:transposase InsO family protein